MSYIQTTKLESIVDALTRLAEAVENQTEIHELIGSRLAKAMEQAGTVNLESILVNISDRFSDDLVSIARAILKVRGDGRDWK